LLEVTTGRRVCFG